MVATIGEILPAAARRFCNRTALLVDGHSFSFAQLDAMSNRIANGLVDGGVLPGDRVTLYGHNCWEWPVAYYGIAKTGAVVNPINVMLTPEEVRFVVEDSGASAIVASSDKGTPLLDMIGTANLSSVVLWGEKATMGAASLAECCKPAVLASTRCRGSPRTWQQSATPLAPPDIRRAPNKISARSSMPPSGQC